MINKYIKLTKKNKFKKLVVIKKILANNNLKIQRMYLLKIKKKFKRNYNQMNKNKNQNQKQKIPNKNNQKKKKKK